MTDATHTLRNWNAKRSADCMTVKGEDCATAMAVKLTNVEAIEAKHGDIIATTKEGIEYQLLS